MQLCIFTLQGTTSCAFPHLHSICRCIFSPTVTSHFSGMFLNQVFASSLVMGSILRNLLPNWMVLSLSLSTRGNVAFTSTVLGSVRVTSYFTAWALLFHRSLGYPKFRHPIGVLGTKGCFVRSAFLFPRRLCLVILVRMEM